jgi:hypothetical protein
MIDRQEMPDGVSLIAFLLCQRELADPPAKVENQETRP